MSLPEPTPQPDPSKRPWSRPKAASSDEKKSEKSEADKQAEKAAADKKAADAAADKASQLPDLLSKAMGGGLDLVSEGTVDLLKRHRSGDRSASDEIVNRYQDRLRRYVRIKRKMRLLDAMGDSQDVVQDAFGKLFRGIDESKFEYRGKDSLYAYLKRIAENLILDDGRKPPRKLNAEDALEVLLRREDEGPGPEESALQRELRQIMDDTVLLLPDKFRDVIGYRFYLGAPADEVAEWMGYSDPQEIHALYHRALAAWRQLLQPRIRAWIREN